MDFETILRLLAGPLIGAVIGVFTNYIAVKMLFRPRHPLMIGKFRVPFTPGIIPRRQPALAKALGRAVSETLFREDDLKASLLSDELCGTVADGVLALPSIGSCVMSLCGSEEKYTEKKNTVLEFLTDRILHGIESIDIGELIVTEGGAAISGITAKNPLLGMFLNEQTIKSFAPSIVEKVNGYLAGNGREKIKEILARELAEYEEKTLAEIVRDGEEFRALLISLIRRLVETHIDKLTALFHITETVENKINAMRPEDLEELVLSVMKKELNAVIWLGGANGFILGVLTNIY